MSTFLELNRAFKILFRLRAAPHLDERDLCHLRLHHSGINHEGHEVHEDVTHFALRDLRGKRLLDRIRRHDLDALDHDALGRLAHFASAVSCYRRLANLIQNIVAFAQLSERRVLVIESRDRR